jgi:DNA-binding Lrp family transcriptional regulator
MDATDRKILALLQEDASLSVAEIGNRVGLSSTPCWKRIQRMEADGVLIKRVALVDQDRLGLGVTVFVSIETGDHSQDWLDRFAQTIGAMPEVMDRGGAAQERHLALRHGEDQVDDCAADSLIRYLAQARRRPWTPRARGLARRRPGDRNRAHRCRSATRRRDQRRWHCCGRPHRVARHRGGCAGQHHVAPRARFQRRNG